MASRLMNVFLSVLLTMIFVPAGAQQKAGNNINNKQDAQDKAPSKKILRPNVYLDSSNYSGGEIQKKELDDLLKKQLTARDSSGNYYKVIGFDFTYAERNLYEDSIGNSQVLVDYMNEYCLGDTITADILASIFDRTKAGDTIFIDHIQLIPYPGNVTLSPADTAVIAGKGLKCVIVK